jgi:hypothetical protein
MTQEPFPSGPISKNGERTIEASPANGWTRDLEKPLPSLGLGLSMRKAVSQAMSGVLGQTQVPATL